MVKSVVIPYEIAKPLSFGVLFAPVGVEGESRLRNLDMLRLCLAHEVPQLFQIVRSGHCTSQNIRTALSGAVMGGRVYL